MREEALQLNEMWRTGRRVREKEGERERERERERDLRRSAQRKHCFVSFRDLSWNHIAPIPIFPSFSCECDDSPPFFAR